MAKAAGAEFGQKEPPLTDHIVNILGRYPDGGQILKELIQNADDAGAKEVKFLYDGRSFGTQYLATNHLEKFQGPALYAFNDALFQDEDWKGIQSLMRSNKKSDILKAGRFGIGFNSVYHITDLPGIVSGNKIGFLDPHKVCFGNDYSGKQYEIDSSLLEGEFRDQFLPFQGVFDFDIRKNYEATLFRFPLRTCPSKLSPANYTKEKVDKLFDSLREEAPVILLFMKNIQRISVYKRNADRDEVKCVFDVKVARETCESVKQERQMMLENAVVQSLSQSKYIVDICLSWQSRKKSFKWLVLNQIGLEGDGRITELSGTLSLPPWVGCAVPLNQNSQNEDSGRIFCFLPLPRDVDCQTGLPVLVHGAFGVTDNRRGLLWPGSECQNNETAEWNVLLVEKVLSSVIYDALKSIIMDNPITGLNEDERRELVYSIVPNINGVAGHWKCLLPPLFQKLKQLNLFHAQSSGPSFWITLQEGLLDQMGKAGVLQKTRNAVIETLLSNSKVITGLPDHVSEMIEEYFGERQDITPEFFRNFLRNNSIETVFHDDKLLLLDYILHDNPPPEKLTRIPLLPLASGKFIPFSQHCHNSNPSLSIFVSTDCCKKELLPNMEDCFLDKKILTETYEKLVSMASGQLDEFNPTQMVTLTPELVINCLRFCLPHEWLSTANQKNIVSWKPDRPRHPPEKWVNDVWHWINDSFDSLEQLEGIPLIPLEFNSKKALGVLSKDSRFIFNSDSSQTTQLPSQIVALLFAAGCVVLPCTSNLLHVRHPHINSYIASPVPAEVTSLLGKSSMELAEKYIRNCSKQERKVLQSFFASSQSLSEMEKNVLRRLPILDTLDGTCTPAVVCGQFLSVASSKFKLPERFTFRKANQVISSAELESMQLVLLLGLEPVDPADIFCQFLFPDIKAQSIYRLEEITTIMLWILERKCEIENPQFLKAMKDLSFVSARNGELKKPRELYDPNDPDLADLFLGEDSKFPSKEFSKLILTLQELGLRGRETITAWDLLDVAKRIASCDYQNALTKVQALVTIFQQKPDLFQLNLGGIPLISKMAEFRWLPRAKKYPHGTGYPSFMHNEWYSSKILFYKPNELFRESHALLVGTSAPILGIKMKDDIQNSLSICKEVNVNNVIEHLKTVVNVSEDKKRLDRGYIEMLKEIYQYLSKVSSPEIITNAIQQNGLVNWIWHGTGFCSPKQMALEKDLPFEFRPPLFLLPEMLNDGGTLTNFFRRHGVREQFSKEDIILVLADMKAKHDKSSSQMSSKCLGKDLKFCRSVLEWLVNDGQRLSEHLRGKVFVPVQSTENKLVLKECDNCTYCDQDWLKHGKTELDIPDDFHLIHESIPPKLALLLGVPSLSSCLLSAESIEFEQTGPYEPITTRIKNILKEYKEGVGIFKELIQNADDAGASTVKFLVDWREGKQDSLFSPDMAASQGPALWAYNNAVFTDKDFENINKLAGGTKVEDISKIGRFGLGFNAVYHLTDVPSFISRNYLCIFDPNVNHISNHIRDKSRPGIRIDLAKNSRPLTAFADQFSLYDKVFGCKTSVNNGEKFHYQGTLFRFSFRTECEAKKSEICETIYDYLKVKEIVRTLQRSASLILLFTQNVKYVELYELASTSHPQDMTLVLSISKEILRTNTVSVPSYIKQCSEWWQKNVPLNEAPSRLEQVEIVEEENPSTITGTERSVVKSCRWLVTYCVGRGRSIKFARGEGKKDGLLPLAGAAALLQSNSDDAMVDFTTLAAKHIEGEAFCFLPLSISTGLPIHVNSSFAVRSNRDGIWEKTTAEKNPESRWNDSLLQDAIPEAYLKLLSGMVDLSKNDSLPQFDKLFHNFWPRLTNLRTSWKTLVSSFYTKLVQRDLKLFCSKGQWMNITDGFILDDDLRKHDDDRVVRTLHHLNVYVFDLPSDVINAMKISVDSSVTVALEEQTLHLVSFFKGFLFPSLPSIPADLRNPIVHDGLRYIFQETLEDWKQLESLYKKTKCIPCSADGQLLAQPCHLINPKSKSISKLYSREENRFPSGKLDGSQLYVLEKLGMVKDLLCWNEICGRAKSIEELSMKNKDLALQRSLFLIGYLRCNVERLKEMQDVADSSLLQNIKFLPVRRTPSASYTLPWEGSRFRTIEFRSPNDLFLPEDDTLIGSSCLIVDDTKQSGCGSLRGLESLLGFSLRRPNCQQVLKQLETTRESIACDKMKITVCKRVYKHLNDDLAKNPDAEVVEKLQNMPWLFLDGKFVENKKIALEWKRDAVPFLYSVPDEYKREFAALLKLAGIKKKFTSSDFLEALDSLKECKKDSQLTPEDISLVVTLANELKNHFDSSVKQRAGTISLPDTKSVLCDSKDLTIPENFRVKYLKSERYIHSDINQNIALTLGAKQLRDRRREKYGNAMSMSFGQFEKLTDRIKNILDSYPCDVGILKELVQNADDAKATEIHFIYDRRTLPHERVLQKKASEVQGPALCVYNNKHFSEDDFNGICKLGIGSKRDDPAKTGQYGIGFNAVYHLTDCPSFLSNNDTLCILDPHCEYSPEATPDAPGGRYNNIDRDFKDIFSDTVSGYLGNFDDHFPLPGCTMFRLPLRTNEQSKTSKIFSNPVTDDLMIYLIGKFQKEAKKLLLFLSHVKKIGLWEINKSSKLNPIYSVSSQLESKCEKELHDLQRHLKDNKKVATCDVPIKDTTYTMCIQDTKTLKEIWLIQQRFGTKTETMTDQQPCQSPGIKTEEMTSAQTRQSSGIKTDATTGEQTPNVCDFGLFPRGGIAALLSSNCVRTKEYVAYCFLPLPVKTSLPVHVNGHFALDATRRDLWFDPSESCWKTKWNAYMKEQVLSPAYALLIMEAREYLTSEKSSDKIYFLSKDKAVEALDWYHELFPDPVEDSNWRSLAVAVYQCLKESPILPVVSQTQGVVAAEKDNQVEWGLRKSPRTRFRRNGKEEASSRGSFSHAIGKYSSHKPKYREFARELNYEHVTTSRHITVAEKRAETPTRFCIEWLPPNLVYFTEEEEQELLDVLLRIQMPVLLYTPLKIHEALLKSKVESHILGPETVIQFLLTSQDENSRCNIGKLPINLSSSNIQNKSSLQRILKYCEQALIRSPRNLEGLPLLLTADDMLRVFTSESLVYCSLYSDLFPDKAFSFVHLDFVPLLSGFCVMASDIIRDLTIESLATEFLRDVFNAKLPLGERKHVPWNYPKKDVLSKAWFCFLWKFLKMAAEPEECETIVKFLGPYPIIPTTDGHLATVHNRKSVLAVTDQKQGNSLEREAARILERLACPILDKSIMKDSLSVALRLVADPHCQSDVLHVLHYMNSAGILDMSKFDEKGIYALLRFFQADCENEKSMNIAKTLPFYKGVDGDYHSLSSYDSYVQIPAGLPDDGIRGLQGILSSVLFLPPAFNLNQLYEALKIKVDCRIPQFYISYVLPHFSSFSRDCQIRFLANLRNMLSFEVNEDLTRTLQSTSCIPDQTGCLRVASRYFNPHNELFKVMFKYDPDVFPGTPFNEKQWLDFLIKIGLKENCNEKQFIDFARGVEESAKNMSQYDVNIVTRSKALVKYLKRSGRNWPCDIISKIEFIVPEKVENELSSFYSQYHVNGKLEFVSYRNSVPWKDRHLVWTSTKLLPDWAYPEFDHGLLLSLGIPSKPPLESVVEHLKIVSKCASEIVVSDRSLSEKIIQVFKDVYEFFKELMQHCAKGPPSSNCTEECRKIGNCLQSIACILHSKERCLVKGERLSFEDVKEKLKPHFYAVPREYVHYEHLLKRLGVTEKITPAQMANVLQSIKDSCTKDVMNSVEEDKACFATSVLFESLRCDTDKDESKLSNCEELNLPSTEKRLVKSSELVCNVQPRLCESVAKQGYKILYPLEKCGLKRELENAYLNTLPKRLRPTPMSDLVREELDPSCKEDMTCIYCTNEDCSFIHRFRLLLRSSQFEHGILRLLKHQKEVSTLDDEDKARAARFTSTQLTEIKCMSYVEIRLVNVVTKAPLRGSKIERTCHVEKQHNSWTLYVQHEFGGRKNQAILAKAVNEIMDGCLKEMLELSDMLSCDSPSQIPGVLDDHNVAPDYNEESEQLGQPVPNIYHYLMIQNPICHFTEGARVAYGHDEGGDKDWKEGEEAQESTSYTLAKILARANRIDRNAKEFDFNAEYKIDFGSKTEFKVVSVLDIYSYNQDEVGNLVSSDDDETQVNVSAEKSNIRRALSLTKKLESLSQRRKVLRRLFLHWFRCKDSKVATEMTTFIESEVTSLGILLLEETRTWTSYWRRRGRREWTTFSGYWHWKSCESSDDNYGTGVCRFYEAMEYVEPNKNEAERWIKQAKADLNSAKKLLDESYSMVCFMGQQCVEKALKGVLYAKCGIPRRELRTHEISRLKSSVSRLEGRPAEVDRASLVASYYLPTRYPDNQPKYLVPAEQYSEEQAKAALEVAETVFTALEKFAHDKSD